MSINGYINGATVHFEPDPESDLRKSAEQASVAFLRMCFEGRGTPTEFNIAGRQVMESVQALRGSGEEW